MTDTIEPTPPALSTPSAPTTVAVAADGSLGESSFADEVVDVIRLAPDAGLVNSLGTNHTLESAVADLVDNSIDAGASHVSVRLLTRDDRLTEVEVLDNGDGMGSDQIDDAMTIGHQRDYRPRDLGHFGMGLKAASFGHSDVLTVWSSRAMQTRRSPHSPSRFLEGLLLRGPVGVRSKCESRIPSRHFSGPSSGRPSSGTESATPTADRAPPRHALGSVLGRMRSAPTLVSPSTAFLPMGALS